MPRPVFIVCADSGVVDKLTNLVSLFTIVEKINFRHTQQPGFQQTFRMMIVSTWMKDPADIEDVVFESEFLLVMPPHDKEHQLIKSEFAFSEGKMLYRGIGVIEMVLPIEAPGVMEVVNRIRRTPEEPWIVQSYPIILEEVIEPAPAHIVAAAETAQNAS